MFHRPTNAIGVARGGRMLLALFVALVGVSLRAQGVFHLTTELSASASDGTSASSKVTVTLAPGTVWHGWFGTNYGGEDIRTPQKLHARRGGLYGLRESEPMCFGILSHKGSAQAGGRSLGGPGSIQQSSSGSMWSLKEDAARFTRDKNGGVLKCTPQVYLDEEPPEFGLLGPGSYPFGSEGDDRYHALLTFRFSNEDLRNLQKVRKVQEGSFTSEDGTVTQRYKLTLEGAPPEDETEVTVTVDEAFDTWKPEANLKAPEKPGNALTFKVEVHKKGQPGVARKAKLLVSLPKVSKNQGICGNWPKEASPEEGLRFWADDCPKEQGLLFNNRTTLESDAPLEKATFRVRSFDYGAWGTLKVTAKSEEGKDLKVTLRGKDTGELDLPLDEDRNRIADAWERSTAYGKARTWDEDTVAGQDAKGDGITLYDEYRGIVAPEGKGGREFRRLSPNHKEIFLLDPSQEFMTAKWELLTRIKAIRLDDSMVDPAGNPGPGESPLVNFNAEDRGERPFFALKIRVRNDNGTDSHHPAYAELWEGSPWCIKNIIAVNIFPARFQRRIEEDFYQLEKAILEPDSPEGVDLRTHGPKQGIPYTDAYAAWTRLKDPALRKEIALKLQRAVFLHEVGHACQLKDHLGDAPVGSEDLARACLMLSQGDFGWGRKRTLIHTALGRGDGDFAYPYREFCTTVPHADYHCFRSLDVKDK